MTLTVIVTDSPTVAELASTATEYSRGAPMVSQSATEKVIEAVPGANTMSSVAVISGSTPGAFVAKEKLSNDTVTVSAAKVRTWNVASPLARVIALGFGDGRERANPDAEPTARTLTVASLRSLTKLSN